MQLFLSLWAACFGISERALNHLIQFLHNIFSMIAANAAVINSIKNTFPTSLYMLKKDLHLSVDCFEKYVICEKCGSLYTFKETLDTSITGRITPKTCGHISF